MVVYMGLAWTPEQRAGQKLALDPNKHDDFIPWEIGSIHKQRNNLLIGSSADLHETIQKSFLIVLKIKLKTFR